MYTKNMLKNDIEAAHLTALKAGNELSKLRQDPEAPAWKIESLEECMEDSLDAATDMRDLLAKTEAGTSSTGAR